MKKNKKKQTPLKAVAANCLACCNASVLERRLCPADECPLHRLRLGKRVDKTSTLKAIRARCLDCKGDSVLEVRECDEADCDLNPYRFGKNPARAGVVGKTIVKTIKGYTGKGPGARSFPEEGQYEDDSATAGNI